MSRQTAIQAKQEEDTLENRENLDRPDLERGHASGLIESVWRWIQQQLLIGQAVPREHEFAAMTKSAPGGDWQIAAGNQNSRRNL